VGGAVYILCAATALTSAVLLARGYWKTRSRVLAWCGVFFLASALENALLFVDQIVLPETNLADLRNGAGLVGGMCLVFGLVWDTR
jgi:hypothetical protein